MLRDPTQLPTQGASQQFVSTSSAFTEGYKGQLIIANEMRTVQPQSGAKGQFAKFFRAVRQFFSGVSWGFRFQMHAVAEHMAQGALAGGIVLTSEIEMKKLLDKLANIPRADQTQTDKAKKLLESFLSVGLIMADGDPEYAVEQMGRRIQNLNPGEIIALPVSTRGHAMAMCVERTDDIADGKKNFKVTLHNTGMGSNNHYSKIDPENTERTLYQTAYEICNVPEEKLNSDFFTDLIYLNYLDSEQGGSKLYKKILPNLGGTRVPQNDKDVRLWSHGQVGGSCAASCLKALLRSQLDNKTYKQLRDLTRMEFILRSWTQIQKGTESYPATQKIVTLEAINQLERSLQKRQPQDVRGPVLPQELEETRNQLQKKIRSAGSTLSVQAENVRHALTESGISSPASPTTIITLNGAEIRVKLNQEGDVVPAEASIADNLNIAFDILTNGVPSESLRTLSKSFGIKYLNGIPA
jgi:hypothetical protein